VLNQKLISQASSCCLCPILLVIIFLSCCRDPPRCWQCGRSGHVSSWCHEQTRQKAITAARKQSDTPLFTPARSSAQTAQSFQHHIISNQKHCVAPTRNIHLPGRGELESRLSLGNNSDGPRRWPGAESDRDLADRRQGRGRVMDFPGNPRKRPRFATRMAWAPDEVQHRREMLFHHALLISDEGPLGVASRRRLLKSLGITST
jgi:hypothetical protein